MTKRRTSDKSSALRARARRAEKSARRQIREMREYKRRLAAERASKFPRPEMIERLEVLLRISTTLLRSYRSQMRDHRARARHRLFMEAKHRRWMNQTRDDAQR